MQANQVAVLTRDSNDEKVKKTFVVFFSIKLQTGLQERLRFPQSLAIAHV